MNGPMPGFRREQGVLSCDSVPLATIAAEAGTPVHVYSGGLIDERYRGLDASLSAVPHRLHYAVKANATLAVVRRQASDLPLTLQISDADIMLPGRTLANVSNATLVARIANGGDPIAKAGDVYGEARWQRSGGEGGPVKIIIDQVVGP